MTEAPAVKTKIPTATEVQEWISELARDGDGADRRWALKMLSAQAAPTSNLPDPLDEQDIVNRLAALDLAAGKHLAQVAFARAFRFKNSAVEAMQPQLTVKDIEGLYDPKKLPVSLKQLYRNFPEIKPRGGYPRGYPVAKGLAVQADWIKRKAIEIIRDRHQKEIDAQKQKELAEAEAAKQASIEAMAAVPNAPMTENE